MNLLDLTLPTVAENLALDEALLEQLSASGEVLRFWESHERAVIVGRASRIADEVNVDACRQADVPILRRCSGGAAVVLGPGCLMYAVALSTVDRPALQAIQNAHEFVLEKTRQALVALGIDVDLAGTSDLVLGNRKFSGNSLRCRRDAILYHGTILYAADLSHISEYLTMPPRQPDYRMRRPHQEFLTNLPVDVTALRRSLCESWDCGQALTEWPRALTEQLVQERYSHRAWTWSR